MTKGNKKYFINILIILIIGGGAIYFSIGSDLESSLKALGEANPFWIIIGLILMAIFYLFDGAILYLFGKLYSKPYTYWQGFKNALSGTFWCGITPFASGGQFAQVYIFNKQGIPPTNSASILLMAFIVYQSILVLYTGVIMLFRFTYYSSMYSGFFSLAILGFVINLCVIGGLFLGAKSKTVQNFLCNTILRFLAKIRIVKNYEDSKIKISQHLENFRTELGLLQKNISILTKTSLLNIGKLTIIYSIPFFTAKALNIDVHISQIFDFIGICSFIYMITSFVPIPGASGGSEGVYFLLFNPILGVGTPTTLLLWRFITYYLGLIIGGVVFATDKEINRSE